MPDLFLSVGGYPALFGLSFLASTLLPLGSEWFLVLLLLDGRPPLATVAVATLGNTLGGCTTYLIGVWGSGWLLTRFLAIDAAAQAKAERLYGRFGSWSLLLSWLPVIGDPLCLVGGVLRMPFPRFLLLVLLGKLGRYATLALLVRQGAPLFS